MGKLGWPVFISLNQSQSSRAGLTPGSSSGASRVQNSAGGEIREAVREMAQSQPQTPQKTIKDVCRLCEDPFIVI